MLSWEGVFACIQHGARGTGNGPRGRFGDGKSGCPRVRLQEGVCVNSSSSTHNTMPEIVSLHYAFSLPEEGGLSIVGDTKLLSKARISFSICGRLKDGRGSDFKGWAISPESVKENHSMNHRGNKFIAMDHIEQHILPSIEDRSAFRFSYLVQVRQPEGNLQYIVATMPQPVHGTKRVPVVQ